MSDCIFCKIVKGEIPSYQVYEDEVVCAFLDITPVNKGHILVIPKAHYENIVDAPEEILCHIVIVIKKFAPKILEAVRAEGFNLGVNNGKVAGQLIPHLHFHIMPRFPNDGHKLWEGVPYAQGEAEKVREAIMSI